MLVNTQAIVLSAIKYSEADLIVCCYTEKDGIKSYLLRNILKAKRAKLKPSLFQPLTQLELVASHKNKGSLEFIREAKVSVPYKTLHTDIVKSGMVLFLAEIFKTCIREEEQNPELYHFIQNSLLWLDENESIANFHIFFLLQLSNYLGFYPNASQIDLPYFNVLEGKFQAVKTDQYCVEGHTLENFKNFFNIDLESLDSIKLSKTSRAAVLELVLTYYALHVQGFRKPNSLSVLNQLFL
ncbi:MAG TPA: DNA repair protein RecO [Aequorivita sp.]|nr:DNA repair protein RecO [Aequorivita sp.]